MPYSLPKDLSSTLNVSLKTVYNYLNKYPDQIRTRKQHWKTFVHSEDFVSLLQKLQSPFKMSTQTGEERQEEKPNWIDNVSATKLQTDVQSLIETNTQLSNRNDALERQIKEYGELFMTEKQEKKEWQEKYEVMQERLVVKTDEFSDSNDKCFLSFEKA